MMSRNDILKRGVILILICAAFPIVLSGCGGEVEDETQVRVQRKVDPGPPPPPPVTAISDLMSELDIDERVVLPEEDAPGSDEARRVVLEFFDAFVRGDAQTAEDMMDDRDQDQLKIMVSEGVWEQVTGDAILEIRIMTGFSPGGEPCALALFETDFSFSPEPQLWRYEMFDGNPVFSAIPTPPDMIDRLSGDDWIAAWYEILDEEVALALKPEVDLDIPQVDLDDTTASRGSSLASPGSTGTGAKPGFPIGP